MTCTKNLLNFFNSAFWDGISDDQQTTLVADIHRPSIVPALVKIIVNQSIWHLLKPQTQTDDVKMQTIQNNMIKAAINWSKILNEVEQSKSPEMLNLGTTALALLGQCNKLITAY